jgi:hypothetical protein
MTIFGGGVMEFWLAIVLNVAARRSGARRVLRGTIPRHDGPRRTRTSPGTSSWALTGGGAMDVSQRQKGTTTWCRARRFGVWSKEERMSGQG